MLHVNPLHSGKNSYFFTVRFASACITSPLHIYLIQANTIAPAGLAITPILREFAFEKSLK